MIHDGKYTRYEVKETEEGVEVETEPLVHPLWGVDIQIVRAVLDAIHRINAASRFGVVITIKARQQKP